MLQACTSLKYHSLNPRKTIEVGHRMCRNLLTQLCMLM